MVQLTPDQRTQLINGRKVITYPGSAEALKALIPTAGAWVDYPAGDWMQPNHIRTDGHVSLYGLPGARFVPGGPKPPKFTINSQTRGSNLGVLDLINIKSIDCGDDAVGGQSGLGLLLWGCDIGGAKQHGVMIGWGFPYAAFIDTTVHDSGSHNVYCEADYVYARGGYYHSAPAGYDAFRLIGWEVLVNGILCETRNPLTSKKVSSSLLVMLAGANTVVVNSTFHRDGTGEKSGHEKMVRRRCRQSINGDGVRYPGPDPNLNPLPGKWTVPKERFGPFRFAPSIGKTVRVSPVTIDPRFYGPDHWARVLVAGLTDPTNPYLSKHFEFNNTYIQDGDDSDGVAIDMEGRAPVNHEGANDPGPDFVPGAKGKQDDYRVLPQDEQGNVWWVDGSVLWVANMKTQGSRRLKKFQTRDAKLWKRGNSNSADVFPTGDPDIDGEQRTASRIIDLGDVEIPPSWFKTTLPMGDMAKIWPHLAKELAEGAADVDTLAPPMAGMPFAIAPFTWR